MDDATGAIYSAFLVEEAGTASTSRALKEVFGVHGLPMSFYTDRGSHSFHTTKAGEIDRGHPAQVGRALAQLGVEPISGLFSSGARQSLGLHAHSRRRPRRNSLRAGGAAGRP